MKKNLKPALVALMSARTIVDAERAVSLLESAGCRWRPVGDRENNYGIINISSDPGHALIERVTNAIDAIIEREALSKAATGGSRKDKQKSPPATPREAAQEWLNIPAGRLAGMTTPPLMKLRQDLADNVRVALHDGSSRRTPTVEIRDLGVGLTPRLLPTTILSLGESNKINKPYLAGAYRRSRPDLHHFRQVH
jgi:hypothetical protein